MSELAATRDEFVNYVRRQLVGPFGGENEVILDPPNRRYLMGILFPRSIAFEGYVEEEGQERDEAAAVSSGEESMFSDDPVSAANDFLPASQGVSFFTNAKALEVRVRAAEYETLSGQAAADVRAAAGGAIGAATERTDDDPRGRRGRPGRVWRRQPLQEARLSVTPGEGVHQLWNGKAEVHARWRSYPRGSLVTVTVVNARTADDQHPERHWDEMLMQLEFDVTVTGEGEILEYPSVTMASHDEEEQELRLIHREARVFAIGHGCAPEWRAVDGVVKVVRSEVMPSFKVPRVTASGPPFQALDIAWLADENLTSGQLTEAFSEFVDSYAAWIQGLKAVRAKLGDRHADAAERIIDRLERAESRMRDGQRVFSDGPNADEVLAAFRLANQAMLMQMRHSKSDLAGSRHSLASAPEVPQQYAPGPTWWPFQLGFFLTTLRGLVDPQHVDRHIVDLIWFPTGGGKTEAYLLVAAFEIFRRRLSLGEAGGGTAVLSRYTLSLLTAQQFQRTASTIAACEMLRRASPETLGDEPISVGLWVGQATTPNSYLQARESFDELRDAGETDDRFLLERCPWCGTEIVPREHSENDGAYGITASDTAFRFNCTSSKCPFHEQLPVRVVDSDLYDNPPSFLLGTVDKFAQLAWVTPAGRLFGRPVGKTPPSLIIQDELHLLTGPLGTTVGLYEAAISLICESNGAPPKVIASTATIRRATEQICGLFGRDVHLFPPAGLSANDSYFATADKEHPGRLYVGLMAQGHTSDTAVVHSGAALLQAPVDLGLTGPAKDAYWTVVAYHSSLRELGRTVTIARDDINARLDSLVAGRPRRNYEVDELSSSVPRSQQPRLLERLNLSCEDASSIDFLATTNMLSVGVDVSRLGLMLMNGQPKATAEYIQATSRVGRSSAPGVVFGLFRSTKPRDRSHYENFRAFHSALYRHVEPTSVTPYSPPARERALHAALVILVRHRLGLADDGAAGQILTRLGEVRELAGMLIEVVSKVEPRESSGARAFLDDFVADWVQRAEEAERNSKLLYYSPNGRGQVNLIKHFNTRGDGWPTLDSMRNVDKESLIEVARSASGQSSGGR